MCAQRELRSGGVGEVTKQEHGGTMTNLWTNPSTMLCARSVRALRMPVNGKVQK